MATYRFEQFKVEIVNPTISVDLNTIQDQALRKLLSVDLTLATDSATFGVTALDMLYSPTWEDEDVEGLVNQWLIQFEV